MKHIRYCDQWVVGGEGEWRGGGAEFKHESIPVIVNML